VIFFSNSAIYHSFPTVVFTFDAVMHRSSCDFAPLMSSGESSVLGAEDGNVHHVNSCCLLSISCNLVDKAISWPDNCARASSFSLSRFHIAWFSWFYSWTLACISTLRLFNCGIFKNVILRKHSQ
jgi:hypothetical protein